MDNNTDKYAFVYDNKSNSWFVISKTPDKYKFCGKIRQDVKDVNENENKIEKIT